MWCSIILVLVVAGVPCAIALLRQHRHHPARILPTLLGVGLTLVGLCMPWVYFSPLNYLLPHGVIGDNLPWAVLWLLRSRGAAWAARLAEMVLMPNSIPGWLLVLVIPQPGIWIALLLVLLTGLGSLIRICALLWTPGAERWLTGRLQVCCALASLLALLMAVPAIDALGQEHQPMLRLLAVVSGAALGEGVWLACLGLSLLVVGGALQPRSRDHRHDTLYEY